VLSSVLNLAFDAATDNIVLDRKILQWVLVPICLVMFLQGILRQYVTTLFLTDDAKVTIPQLQKNLLVRRSARLRANAQFLPPSAFRMRKRYFVLRAFGDQKEGAAADAAAGGAGDPFAMMGMMKQNISMILPNIILMGWVSYFFSGFVLVKLPFGLYDRFKSMTQRGIVLKSLDPSYVSSMSWYFINLVGLRGLFSLVLGDGNSAIDNTKAMTDQMSGAALMQQQQPDMNAVFNVEKTELEILQHYWAVPAAELRLLQQQQQQQQARA